MCIMTAEIFGAEETWQIGKQPVPQQAACAVLQMQKVSITDNSYQLCAMTVMTARYTLVLMLQRHIC